MIWQYIGMVIGYAVLWSKALARSLAVRWIVITGTAILVIPSITRYWLSRVALPVVPLSAIVAMVAASLMLFAFASAMYVAFLFLQQTALAPQVYPQQPGAPSAPYRRGIPQPETGGSFIPMSDEGAAIQEEIAKLRKKGILKDEDTMSLEERAMEIGLEMMQNKRGKTE